MGGSIGRVCRVAGSVAVVAATGVGAGIAGGVTLAVAGAGPKAGAATGTYSPPSAAYWTFGANGEVENFNSAFSGDMRSYHLTMVGGAAAPDGTGYWLVSPAGGVFAFGSARFYGSEGGVGLTTPIVAMAVDQTTGGYWLVAANGAIFSFNAPYLGRPAIGSVASPIVGMAATADGGGYWLAEADGAVLNFGDARPDGSMLNRGLRQPLVGMTATSDGNGYWLVSSSGGVYSFGDAGFHGSMSGVPLPEAVTGITAAAGGGYWLSDRDGAVFSFDAPFLGAAYPSMGSTPVVGIAGTGAASVFPVGVTGYDVSEWQCPSYSGEYLPSGAKSFAVTQVSGGNLTQAQPSGCYNQEASWAGENQMAYIFMDPIPGPQAERSMSGPVGNCSVSNLSCQSYNYGWNWAQYWVSYAKAEGADPLVWFLDVETSGGWSETASAQADNSNEILGAINGLKAAGNIPGIYSDNYQFELITGGRVSAPGIPLWMAGAADLAQAEAFCSGDYNYDYEAFAGGRVVMAQYVSRYDQDYTCS